MRLIFDLDGTLFQTEKCTVEAVRRLRKELGLPPLPDEQIICHIGETSKQFLQAVLGDKPDVDLSRVQEQFHELERQEVAEHGSLFPGVHDVLKRLSHRYTLYICSNGSPEYIDLVLSSTDVARYFHIVRSAEDFASKVEAVEALVRDDRKAVVIGDTVADAQAAAENRLPFVWAAYGYSSALSNNLLETSFPAAVAEEIESHLNRITLFYELSARLSGKRVVGINGVDTSGKTEFTQWYSRFLTSVGMKNQVLHIDDFHNPALVREAGANPVDAYYQNAFDYDKLLNEVLLPLRKEGRLNQTVTCLNLNTDEYQNKITYHVERDSVLLIEGVLLFRPPLLSFLDGTVFLDIPFDEVLRRAQIRDVPKYGTIFLERYRKKYIPIQERYLREHRPKEVCDVLIDNRNYDTPLIVNK